MRNLMVLIGILLSTLPLAAQFQLHETNALQPDSPECALGLKYDSGVYTNSINAPVQKWIMVMRFDLPPGTTGLRQVCANILRDNVQGPTVPYDMVVFDDNGPNGAPGTLLKSISGVATMPAPGRAFVSADFSNSGLQLPDLSVYVGIRMDGNHVAVSVDLATTTAPRVLQGSETNGFGWAQISPTVRALAVRVDPIPECIPSATALCLNGRFKVEATYTTASASGAANGVKLTDETGYLWFFNSTNVEAVVKVLNGCGINNAYWVFAGGLTDVNTVVKVTDVRTGQVKTYTNPQGTPFQPIQDVNAFSGAGICP